MHWSVLVIMHRWTANGFSPHCYGSRGGDRTSASRTADRAGPALGRAMIGGGLLVLLLVNWTKE